MKTFLSTVTLLGIDCVDLQRLQLAAEICQERFTFAETKLLSSLPGKDVVSIAPINSIEAYSRFVIEELDAFVTTSHVLLIQYDGFILNPAAWDNDFLQYDYIGAPWLVADWAIESGHFPESFRGKRVVGNGGFSLRSKRFIHLCARLAKEGVFAVYDPEDAVLCVRYRKLLEEHGMRFAPVDVAQQFSFEAEGPEHYQWNGQFGFHGLKWTGIDKWLENRPGWKADMQKGSLTSPLD